MTFLMQPVSWLWHLRLETTNLAAKADGLSAKYGKNKKPDPWSG